VLPSSFHYDAASRTNAGLISFTLSAYLNLCSRVSRLHQLRRGRGVVRGSPHPASNHLLPGAEKKFFGVFEFALIRGIRVSTFAVLSRNIVTFRKDFFMRKPGTQESSE
jgi:hypothetical protein